MLSAFWRLKSKIIAGTKAKSADPNDTELGLQFALALLIFSLCILGHLITAVTLSSPVAIMILIPDSVRVWLGVVSTENI